MSLPLRFTILLYSAALAISLSVTALLPSSHTQVLSPQSMTVEQEEQPPVIYVLKADAGELCIFKGSELLRRTGVFVSSLPEEDRFSLEAGITASSQQALTSLLEDLCS